MSVIETEPTSTAHPILRALGVPPPDQSRDYWHVSPIVDVLAYHYSWLLVLAPMVFLGENHPKDYMGLFVFVMVIAFAHRHVTMPYVYMDGQVFRAHPYRFTIYPAFLFAAFLVTPSLYLWKVPPNTFTPAHFGAWIAAPVVLYQWWFETTRGHDFTPTRILRAAAPTLAAAAFHVFASSWDDAGPLQAWAWLAGLTASSWLVALDAARTPTAAHARPRFPWYLEPFFDDVDEPATPAPALRLLVPGVLTLMAAGIAASGSSFDGVAPAKAFDFKGVILFVAFFGALWNIWHVFMQRYGIFRMYAAKSQVPLDVRVPGWVDRLMVFAWLPLYFVWMGPNSRDELREGAAVVIEYVEPIADAMERVQPFLLAPSIAVVLFSLGAFAYYEWRASGLKNMARVSMALGTTGLSASFLLVNPIKAYVAYGFCHAVEYIVFIWAYQRRRYAHPLAHRPLLGEALRWPVLSWTVFMVVVGGAYLVLQHSDDLNMVDEPLTFFGHPAYRLVFFWTIYHSLTHFYWDGFLWKMRLPTVRANL